jgi:hypothetical protein
MEILWISPGIHGTFSKMQSTTDRKFIQEKILNLQKIYVNMALNLRSITRCMSNTINQKYIFQDYSYYLSTIACRSLAYNKGAIYCIFSPRNRVRWYNLHERHYCIQNSEKHKLKHYLILTSRCLCFAGGISVFLSGFHLAALSPSLHPPPPSSHWWQHNTKVSLCKRIEDVG